MTLVKGGLDLAGVQGRGLHEHHGVLWIINAQPLNPKHKLIVKAPIL